MTTTPMLAKLFAQSEAQGADMATLRALVEEASELGASRALARIGLHDAGAGADILELRQLIGGWRDAKRAAVNAAMTWTMRTLVAAILIGLAVKLGMVGLIRP